MTDHSTTTPADQTVLFLDVDGTIGPLADTITDAWGDQTHIPCDRFPDVATSPSLLKALGALPVRIVWATDWEDPTPTFTPELMGLTAPLEHLTRPPYPTTWWKAEAVLAWLDAHPEVRRVIWCDDHLNFKRGRLSAMKTELDQRDLAHLLVAPTKNTGLTPAHLSRINHFLGGTLP